MFKPPGPTLIGVYDFIKGDVEIIINIQINLQMCKQYFQILHNSSSNSIAHKLFQCYSNDSESMFASLFNTRMTKGIDMDGETILDGERSGYLYWHFPFTLGEVEDQRQGLPFCKDWRKPYEGLDTLSEKGPRRMACGEYRKDERGAMICVQTYGMHGGRRGSVKANLRILSGLRNRRFRSTNWRLRFPATSRQYGSTRMR